MISTHMTMGQAFGHAAAQHPGREALVCGPERATYSQVAENAAGLVRGLHKLGVRKGDRVATLLPPCAEFVSLFFALAQLGGVVVPINPEYRRRQLDRILSDADPMAIVTSAQVGEEALGTVRTRWSQSLTPRYLILTEGANPADLGLADLTHAAFSVPLALPPLDPSDLLALLYTSGTTGFPKGVMHSHRSLMAPVVASMRLRQM